MQMNKIMSAFGAVVAMCSLNVAPARAAAKDCAVPSTMDRSEVIMDRLLQNIEPTFSGNFPDLGDQSFKST